MNKPIILTGREGNPAGYLFPDRRRGDCDCDCACESLLSLPPIVPTIEGNWIAEKRAHPVFSTGPWTSIYNSSGPIALSVMNETALDLWKGFEQPGAMDHLDQNVLEAGRTMIATGLLIRPDVLSSLAGQKSTTLSAWLHLTNACNLRCDYCYLNKTQDGMSWEVASAALRMIFETAHQYEYSSVKLKYAGGEPLIRFGMIRDIHQEARRLQDQYQLELEEVILTNGTLLRDEQITFLINQHIRLSLSLDGIAEVHDRQRPLLGGKGSFAEIERGLDLCLEKGYSPDITVTITDRNADQLAETTDYLLKKGLHFNFNFYRENDCSLPFQDLQYGEGRMIDGIRKAYQVIERNLPEWSLLGSLADRSSFQAPHSHTCSVGRDYLVIDHHGNIAKCQMTMGIPITTIHAPDPLLQIRNDQTGLQNPSVDEKEGCKTCSWKFWCSGGCSLATYRATGRYDIKSPNCNIYKAIYPELLRLESLRLIKYAAF